MVSGLRIPGTFVLLIIIILVLLQDKSVKAGGTVEEWTKVKQMAWELANSGLDRGEVCDPHVTKHTFTKLTHLIGETPTFLSGTDADPANMMKEFDPSKKRLICAVKKGLFCEYDPVKSICQLCAEIKHDTPSYDDYCTYYHKEITNAADYQ